MGRYYTRGTDRTHEAFSMENSMTDGNLEYRVEILERKITRLMSQVKELNDTLFSDDPIYVPTGDEDS
jgi:hypothetical protein